MNTDVELFEKKPITKAVLTMVVPTVISQIITVLYNMADTFFIGKTNDPNQVAAAGVCLPFFIMITGFANLFGIGGSGTISRARGRGETKRAKSVAAFCLWTAGFVGILYGILIYTFRDPILHLFGADDGTYEFCCKYIFWVILIGAMPSVLNATLAHLVRAEGHSKEASIGLITGGVLNILLDPLFISILGMDIEGAALATMISNTVSAIYFIIYICFRKEESVIVFNPKHYSVKEKIPKEVFFTGLPSALMSLMSTFSNATVNKMLSNYCNEAVAGVGIAKKIDMMAFGIATGMSQGVVPLIGYNYSSKNYARMKKAIKTTLLLSLSVALTCFVILFSFSQPIVKAFIDDPKTIEYGKYFQRIICLTGPCISVTLIIITVFQACGKKLQPLFLSLLRKGGLDVPFMILMNNLAGVKGILWATPIADFLAMTMALLLFIPFWRDIKKKELS